MGSTTLLHGAFGGAAALQQRHNHHHHGGGDASQQQKQQCSAAASVGSSIGTLCFDVELDEGGARQQAGARHKSNARHLEVLKHFLQPTGAFAAQTSLNVACVKRSVERDGAPMDMVELASRLAAMGADVTVRTSLGPAGCPGGAACFCHLRHEFITVRAGPGDWEGTECIVEPFFREHFEIPRPTPEYRQLLEAVPDVLVASSSQLTLVVQALCTAMAESFAAYGMSLPPWRRAKSMLSKWLPPCARDVAVRRPTAADGGAATAGAAGATTVPLSSALPSASSSPGGGTTAAASMSVSTSDSSPTCNGHSAHHHCAAAFGSAFVAPVPAGAAPTGGSMAPIRTVSSSEFEDALAALMVEASASPLSASRSSPPLKRRKQSLLTTAMTLAAASKCAPAAAAPAGATPVRQGHHAASGTAGAAAAVGAGALFAPAAPVSLSSSAVVMSLPPVSAGEPTIYKIMHHACDQQEGAGQHVQ